MTTTNIFVVGLGNKLKHTTLKAFGIKYVHSQRILSNAPQEWIALPNIPGSGAGRGGGAGGAVRESGGGLGQYGAAQEEGFFHKKQKELLKKLKEKIKKSPNPEKRKDN